MKIPGRSVIAGFIASTIVAGAAALITSKFGISIPPEFGITAVAALTGLLIHLIPDSVQSIIDQLNDNIVIKAMRDPDSDVSAVLPPQA